jgi:GNAT superfamily N-acetyltransferase
VTDAPAPVDIRRATVDDAKAIGDVWLGSWRATFDFEPSHPDDDVRRWIREELVPHHETWVATEGATQDVVALLALSDSMVEQLYVRPDRIGHGIGRRLLAFAKGERPSGLELYCFAANARARRFYERNGFEAAAFGDGSGNMERQPDVLYRWRPS